MLAGALKHLLLRPVLFPLHRITPCPVIRGNNTVADRSAVLSPEIEPLAVAADCRTDDLLTGNLRLFDRPADHFAVGFPHLVHVPLRKAGLRHKHRRIHSGNRHLSSGLVKDSGFGGCSAVVQTKIIPHNNPLYLSAGGYACFTPAFSGSLSDMICIIPVQDMRGVFSCKEIRTDIDRHLINIPQRFHRLTGDMRRNDRIFQCQKRTIHGQRFFRKHIQPPILPVFRASYSASSSIMFPRAVLTITAVGFIIASVSLFTI